MNSIDNISAKINFLEEEKTRLQNIESFEDKEHEELVEKEIEKIQNEIDYLYEDMDEAILNSI
jgi:hypothetical protein